MPTPLEGKVNDLARSFNRVERTESFHDDSAVLFFLARFSQRMTERPLDENSPGWFDLFCVLANDGNPNRGYACFFDFSLDQSDRLVADASGRG
jgi:hypothetical protein